MIKIAVDCFGGDHSPDANIEGGLSALAAFPDLHLVLTGDSTVISSYLAHRGYDGSRLEILHAPEVIGCDEKPTDAIRLKKDSSMIKAIRLVRDDDSVQGMVSVGSTGALVAGALTRLGVLDGVIRPAFCPLLPTMNGGFVGICDSGANVEANAGMLKQFAIMSSLYMENVFGIHRPRVALLNVGKEAEKGDTMRQRTYASLKALGEVGCINFVGNMESRDLLSGSYDAVVCDGFAGNVLVKTTEGTAIELLKMVRQAIFSRTIYKIGAMFQKKMFTDLKQMMNYQNYGGSVLLGCSKVVVKGHGSSNSVAVHKCIEQAYRMVSSTLGTKIEAVLDKYDKYEG